MADLTKLTDDQLMALANAPQQVEIQFSGTTGRSATNNNPFNIIYNPYFAQKYGAVMEPPSRSGQQKFLKFPDMMSGYLAGLEQIQIDQRRGHSLSSFVNKFSPPYENPTTELISQYGQAVGAGPNTPLAAIDPVQLSLPMAARESSTKISMRPVAYQQPANQLSSLSDEELMAIAGQPKPQPGQVLSIPDILSGPFEKLVAPQQPNTLIPPPERLESVVGGYIPQSIKDALSWGSNKIGGAINYLTPTIPQTGAIGGGMAGARLGAMTGNPLGSLAGGIIGAGLGYAGTRQAENVAGALQGEQMPPIPEQLTEVGKDIGKGALMQIGGETIGAMGAPFANRVAQRMAENAAVREAQNMVAKGVPISPSEISGSKLSRFFEGLAERVWPASSRMAKYRNSLQDVANGLKDEFVESRGLYDVSKQSVGEAWNNWVNLAGGPEALYPMPNTRAALNNAMNQPFATGKFWSKDAKTFYDQLQFSGPGIINKTGEVSVQAIRDLFNTLRPGSAKGAERTAMMKIADAVATDLASIGGKDVSDALGIAREMTYLNRVATPLRNIFNAATIEPTKAGEDVIFSPAKFVNIWNQRRPNFIDNPNFSDKDVLVIDKFSDMMKALTSDLAKGAKAPTGSASMMQLNLRNPIAVGTAIYKQPLLSFPVGADWFLAGSLMKPNGYMRRFLTTGLKPPTLPVKIGIGKYLEGREEND